MKRAIRLGVDVTGRLSMKRAIRLGVGVTGRLSMKRAIRLRLAFSRPPTLTQANS